MPQNVGLLLSTGLFVFSMKKGKFFNTYFSVYPGLDNGDPYGHDPMVNSIALPRRSSEPYRLVQLIRSTAIHPYNIPSPIQLSN